MPSSPAQNLLLSTRRVVLKFGSSLVCGADGVARHQRLGRFVDDIAAFRARGTEVIVVTSGAIALGRGVLKLEPPLRLDEQQAAAAAGQAPLTMAWQKALGRVSLPVAQILLTLDDTEDRRRYLNARATIETLLELGAIPLVNENDTIATSEIRYGDNDRLAAHTAQMLGADLLVLLSDIDGLYSGDPSINVNAEHIPVITLISKEIESYAQGPNKVKNISSGGMITKIAAARIAANAGAAVMIINGQDPDPLGAVLRGEARASVFMPAARTRTARQQWIAGRQKPAGAVHIDSGAATALLDGSSLLPAGVTRVCETFQRGDLVAVIDPQHRTLALGLAAYDSDEISAIKGVHSDGIEAILGYRRRPSIIHRDDLVLDAGMSDEQI